MYWACALRESWEEMGLWPWGVEFLGVLPVYRLRLFQRKILPLVGWIRTRPTLRPNWEVERILPIPLASLMDGKHYRVCIFHGTDQKGGPLWGGPTHFPCFTHQGPQGTEVLWGATYHIVLSLLDRAYGFQPPPVEGRPVIHRTLSEAYLTGETRPFSH